MTPYEEINGNLHDVYHWSQFARPANGPVEEALAAGQTSAAITSALHQFVMNAFTQSAFYPTYEQASYSIFVENGHFWVLNTAVALGLQHEAPVEKIREARTVAEFIDNLNHGYNRLGYRDDNCGPATEQGKLRRAAAKVPPAEWKGYEEIWELAILSGSIPVGLTGFSTAYAQTSPKLREVRGLDAQQYLDNLWTPGMWKPVQAAK